MPTLVWRRWPESTTSSTGAKGVALHVASATRDGSQSATRREAAVPDPVVSAATAAVLDVAAVFAISDISDPVAPPFVTSKRYTDVGSTTSSTERKRKLADPTKAANKKKSKTTIERKLPTGVYKTPSGKFIAVTCWGGKNRHIGTFDTPEQASAAYVSVKKDLDDAKRSAFGADEVDAAFDEAKKKALEAVGGTASSERDLPKGVYKAGSRKFMSRIMWGGKKYYIGIFDTPEQASAAYMSAKKDLKDAKLSVLSADEESAVFDEARKKFLKSVCGFVPKNKDLPTGVRKLPSGRFQSTIGWGGKAHYVGTFDTPEQASAAFMFVKNELARVKLSALGADEVNAAFNEAKKKALESFGKVVPERQGSLYL